MKEEWPTACERMIGRYHCCSVVQGDCLELMNGVPKGKVDALITDPPYGIDFAGKITKYSDNRGVGDVYPDSLDNFRTMVLPAIEVALRLATRGAVFSGTRRIQEYPSAKDIGGIICPNGGGRSSWGFGCYHPVLFYGNSPYMGARPTATVMYHPGMHVTGENWIEHPCPKPIAFMSWLVERASLEGQTVFDPFCGSGTTLVAARKLGRHLPGF